MGRHDHATVIGIWESDATPTGLPFAPSAAVKTHTPTLTQLHYGSAKRGGLDADRDTETDMTTPATDMTHDHLVLGSTARHGMQIMSETHSTPQHFHSVRRFELPGTNPARLRTNQNANVEPIFMQTVTQGPGKAQVTGRAAGRG
eukprot:scaffold1549_cov350-Prasinococcus_capsulatus_cf.AAC.15